MGAKELRVGESGQREPSRSGARASELRLGFVSGAPGFLDGHWWVHPALGRLVEALADRCQRVVVALAREPAKGAHLVHPLIHPRVGPLPLPHMPSIARGLWRHVEVHAALRALERQTDVVLVQLPFSTPTALFGARTPRVYHVCADLPAVVGASQYYRGGRRLAAVSAAHGIDWMQRRLMRSAHAAAVTNGEALLRRYAPPRGRHLVSSTLRRSEVGSVVRHRPKDAPFRILFVGYFRPEKGIDVLLGAYERLLERHPETELVLVGAQDLVEGGAARDAEAHLARVSARGHVQRLGALPFGPELFRVFADADVLALPSRSEGTPRVLVEARAFGCPVVASSVGGVPSSVRDGVDGLLVPPGDIGALADALLRVKEEPALHARLAAAGLERASSLTVDAQAEALLEEAKGLLS